MQCKGCEKVYVQSKYWFEEHLKKCPANLALKKKKDKDCASETLESKSNLFKSFSFNKNGELQESSNILDDPYSCNEIPINEKQASSNPASIKSNFKQASKHESEKTDKISEMKCRGCKKIYLKNKYWYEEHLKKCPSYLALLNELDEDSESESSESKSNSSRNLNKFNDMQEKSNMVVDSYSSDEISRFQTKSASKKGSYQLDRVQSIGKINKNEEDLNNSKMASYDPVEINEKRTSSRSSIKRQEPLNPDEIMAISESWQSKTVSTNCEGAKVMKSSKSLDTLNYQEESIGQQKHRSKSIDKKSSIRITKLPKGSEISSNQGKSTFSSQEEIDICEYFARSDDKIFFKNSLNKNSATDNKEVKFKEKHISENIQCPLCLMYVHLSIHDFHIKGCQQNNLIKENDKSESKSQVIETDKVNNLNFSKMCIDIGRDDVTKSKQSSQEKVSEEQKSVLNSDEFSPIQNSIYHQNSNRKILDEIKDILENQNVILQKYKEQIQYQSLLLKKFEEQERCSRQVREQISKLQLLLNQKLSR